MESENNNKIRNDKNTFPFRGGWNKRKKLKTIPLDVFGDILLTSDGFYRLICKSIHKFGDPGPKNFLNFEALPLPGIESVNNINVSPCFRG